MPKIPKRKLPTKKQAKEPKEIQPATLNQPATFEARRGIKFGRVRKIIEERPVRNQKGYVSGYQKITVGYEDKKTGKRLNSKEVSSYKAKKAAPFLAAQRRKHKEGHYTRAKKIKTGTKLIPRKNAKPKKVNEYKYVDKFTGKELTSTQIKEVKVRGLKALVASGNTPKNIRSAISTIQSRQGPNGLTNAEVQKKMEEWFIKYHLDETTDFPSQGELYPG